MVEYYEIMREDVILGPFEVEQISEFVTNGLILTRDCAYNVNNPDIFMSVGEVLKEHSYFVSVEQQGSIFNQIRAIGKDLIIPSNTFKIGTWKRDISLLVVSIIGFSLSVIMAISQMLSAYMTFYLIALYFSAMWGLFFYFIFINEQIKPSTTLKVFFGTQIFINVFFFIATPLFQVHLEPLFTSENPLLGCLSCIIGIGIPEEIAKAVPVFLIILKRRFTTKATTAVFYGLISGIAFGVYEGVQYQLGPNFHVLQQEDLSQAYTLSYVSNIARLTSLPFLHAVWSGISAFFLANAFLYPRFKSAFYVLALFIPASIHGFYDFICFNFESAFLSLPIVFLGLILLKVYLAIGKEYKSKLE